MYNRVTVPPTVEPITLAEAKLHLRVTDTAQDAIITALIQAAREYVELYCGRSLITQTREQVQDAFYEVWKDSSSKLLYGPVQSISSITYIDGNGIVQTIDQENYVLNNGGEPYTFYNAYGFSWPAPRYTGNAVTITYVAGYVGLGSPLDLRAGVPAMIKVAIKMLIGHWYEARESAGAVSAPVPFGVETILSPFRLHIF